MDDKQLLRYNRQIMVPGFDINGQQQLLSSSVLIIGLGGLGCPAAQYLATAGVGKLILADGDQVELTNLQRQVLHTENNLGLNKAVSAKSQLQQLNSDCEIEVVEEFLQGEELNSLVSKADLVIDCTDNFEARFAINQACFASKKPLVSAAAIQSEAQVSVFDPRLEDSPCYQCLYQPSDEQAPSCSENGVLGPLVGIVGAMQAMEALKLLTDYGQPLVGKLLILDAALMQWREFKLKKDKQCLICRA